MNKESAYSVLASVEAVHGLDVIKQYVAEQENVKPQGDPGHSCPKGYTWDSVKQQCIADTP